MFFDPDTTYVKCPECKHVSLLDDCEVVGADDGHVFCYRNWPKDGREFWVDENLFAFDEAFDEVSDVVPVPDQLELF